MTFDQLLYKVSHKVSELQEVLNNMKEDRRKRERLPEYQAIQLMAEAMRNAETELHQLNVIISQFVVLCSLFSVVGKNFRKM